MNLPSITDFAKLLEIATNPDSDATARNMAATHLMMAYARAECRASDGSTLDPDYCHIERDAAVEALSEFRAVRAESRAVESAELEHAIKVDEEDKRVKHEASVPWGEEQR